MINCNEMRTEGTSRPSDGMFPRRTDPKFLSPCNLVQALDFSLITSCT